MVAACHVVALIVLPADGIELRAIDAETGKPRFERVLPFKIRLPKLSVSPGGKRAAIWSLRADGRKGSQLWIYRLDERRVESQATLPSDVSPELSVWISDEDLRVKVRIKEARTRIWRLTPPYKKASLYGGYPAVPPFESLNSYQASQWANQRAIASGIVPTMRSQAEKLRSWSYAEQTNLDSYLNPASRTMMVIGAKGGIRGLWLIPATKTPNLVVPGADFLFGCFERKRRVFSFTRHRQKQLASGYAIDTGRLLWSFECDAFGVAEELPEGATGNGSTSIGSLRF